MVLKNYNWSNLIQSINAKDSINIISTIENNYNISCSLSKTTNELESSLLLIESITEKLWAFCIIGVCNVFVVLFVYQRMLIL